MTRRRRRWIIWGGLFSVVAFVTGVIFVRGVVVPAAVDRLHGNAPIRFYGRIVGTDGAPIQDARVEFQILYSDKVPVPLPWGRQEKTRYSATKTDAKGDFQLVSQSGYSFSIVSMRSGGRVLEFAAPPPITVFPLDSSRFYMADDPSKRRIYRVSLPAKSPTTRNAS